MRKKKKNVPFVLSEKPRFIVDPETLQMSPFEAPRAGDTIRINSNQTEDCPDNIIILADGYLTADPCFHSCIIYWTYGIWYTYQIMETDKPNVGILVLVQTALPNDNPGREVLSTIGHMSN